MADKTKAEEKDLTYWKSNAEENYITTPISVLRYITELENSRQSGIDQLTKEVERLKSQLAKIYMYAEQMSLDLLESSEFIEGSYESLANYKNHMQSLTTH